MNPNVHLIPPIFKLYPILPRSCTCGQRIGFLQREIEELTVEYQKTMSLEDARIAMMKDLKLFKMCCREKITNCTTYNINDLEADAHVNLTVNNNGNSSSNNYSNIYTSVSWGWVTKTKGMVEFDEIDYCMNIQSLLFGPPTSISGVHQNFPVFPKLVPSEVLSMPMEVNTNTILHYYQNEI